MPPTFSPLWMQTLTGSDYTPPPPSSPQPYKVRSPCLPLPRNAISLYRKQPLGVTTVSSPPKTRNIKNALQMPHTLYKNNGLTRQAASEYLFEIHSQMVVAPSNISWLSIALL